MVLSSRMGMVYKLLFHEDFADIRIEILKRCLTQTQAQFHTTVLNILNASLMIPNRLTDLEPTSLWRASEDARKKTVTHMIDFCQRIRIRAPIPRPFGSRQEPVTLRSPTLSSRFAVQPYEYYTYGTAVSLRDSDSVSVHSAVASSANWPMHTPPPSQRSFSAPELTLTCCSQSSETSLDTERIYTQTKSPIDIIREAREGNEEKRAAWNTAGSSRSAGGFGFSEATPLSSPYFEGFASSSSSSRLPTTRITTPTRSPTEILAEARYPRSAPVSPFQADFFSSPT